PKYVHRNYTAPVATPGYLAGPAPALEVSSAGGFASDTVDPPTGPTPPMQMPSGTAALPAPTAVAPAPLGSGAPTVVTGAPYLDGMASGFGMPAAGPTVWVAPEFIHWQMKGIGTPALVTTAPAGSAGTLGAADTAIAYGSNTTLQNWRSGFRIRGGYNFADGMGGIEAAFFTLGDNSDNFAISSEGSPGVFRPFRDATTGLANSQLIAFIDPVNGQVLAGGVSIENTSELTGGELNYRYSLTEIGLGNRFDLLVGYRYMSLRDKLAITSNLTAGPAAPLPAGTGITSFDRFETDNTFHGGQVGFVNEWQLGRMSFNLRGTLAAGWTQQEVDISGGTSTTAGVSAAGGLLAQTTNIGSRSYDRFSVIPEIGLTVGYCVTDNLRLTAGYNFLYWTNVARSAEQIDQSVNPNFIPDPTGAAPPRTGVAQPAADRRDTGFWAHGVTAGIEWKW
ncbi:MAG TPA: BBP7 family outer membrane beta-barrel protein, partial [Gemmataceae bacterium]|nr:BBP7 family outer membrane beta-barrel protein [Gemmataceae bacterium]